jgi:energy-coupling factor transporter transmembrane protein EcfT
MILDSVHAFSGRGNASRLDAIDPRCRVLCALCLAVTAAAVGGAPALAAGSVLPLWLLCVDGRSGILALARMLSGVNKVSVAALIFLPLTYPGDRVLMFFSVEGARAALLIIWKLNIISVVLLRMVASMGITGVNDALAALRFPVKLRMLLLLTTRYVFLLADRMSAMARAIDLRAPDIRGKESYRAHACMVGTTLVHSADRAERASLAIGCRGGMSGFSQSAVRGWTRREWALCALFLLNSICLAVLACR